MSLIRWTHGRASAHTPRLPIPVVNVPPGHGYNIRFLGNPVCTLTHWGDGRSLPCVAHATRCPFCLQHSEKIHCGYAAAQQWSRNVNGEATWITIVISLTDVALETLIGKQLRGHIYALKRADERVRSKLHATFHMDNKIGLPPEFDPLPIVERCWANYLATFGDLFKMPAPGEPFVAPVEVADVVKELGDILGMGQAQPDRARNGKGGVQ